MDNSLEDMLFELDTSKVSSVRSPLTNVVEQHFPKHVDLDSQTSVVLPNKTKETSVVLRTTQETSKEKRDASKSSFYEPPLELTPRKRDRSVSSVNIALTLASSICLFSVCH
jgi:hypothetical protein